jgi:hypothetical protein
MLETEHAMNVEKTGLDILRQVKEHVRNGTYILRDHAVIRID